MLFLMPVGGWIAIGAVLLVVIIFISFLISQYNSLVINRNRVRNGWSQIDVHLKRRFDLIPNLLETVKGYVKHEAEIFGEFAKARNLYAQANNPQTLANAEKELSGALSRLLMVQERYPDLQANDNFKMLMSELSDTEDKIAYTRQFYNDSVLKYNNKVELFPSNIIAGWFKFEKAEFFEVVEESQREAPKVSF
ncbi:MAG: LemA family protein [Bacilli bacterium]|jgi:LemA protein|nr:LemA family protein [Bacilli bacterium]MDD2681521.1 LemA family protein [Bacilli bacterium]MDD3121054.1 LemA family protein [Bacilli bacterium]MDD4063228.1 LemA family protein [Bacilli bacterium]MDD4481868.1 LemA family protein [Bacilli bacterium]